MPASCCLAVFILIILFLYHSVCVCVCACCDCNCLTSPLSWRSCAKVWFINPRYAQVRAHSVVVWAKRTPGDPSARAQASRRRARARTLAWFPTRAHLPLGTRNTHVSIRRGTSSSSGLPPSPIKRRRPAGSAASLGAISCSGV